MTQSPPSPTAPSPAGDPTAKAVLFDYRQAANPVRAGLTEPIPYCSWSPELHAAASSGVIPLDLSSDLGIEGPATSPGLAAHFVRIHPGQGIKAAADAPRAAVPA